jgi:hypothetical protein
VFNDDGAFRCIEGFITDLTQLQRARLELDALNKTLEDKVIQRTMQLATANAEMEAIAYSIAHDLRAPMTSISAFAQVLKPAIESLDPKNRHFLERILANVARMQEITTALLSLASLSSVQPRREDVDLAEIVQRLFDEMRSREPNRVAHLMLQDSLECSGDAALLNQLLANLLSNAWEFSASDRDIEIEVGTIRNDQGLRQVFFVRDNGVGFDMAHAGHLFKPFSRLHTIMEFEGTGIGLALVRKIVQRHGGDVWIESEPGQGTTVFFTLAPSVQQTAPA